MQNVIKCSDIKSNEDKCVETEDFNHKVSSSNTFVTNLQDTRKTVDLLEKSFLKTSKYEGKLARCRNGHSCTHDSRNWTECSRLEQKGNSSSSISGDGQAESWSTLSVACLQYQYKELSKRYEALLQAYDAQCHAICVRDIKLAQWRQRAHSYHAELAHAHKSLLAIGQKYLGLTRKKSQLKIVYEKKLNGMKSVLHDAVELIEKEQLDFDAKLSHFKSTEKNSDAALLLNEMRKCNLLFLENIRLKTVIQEHIIIPHEVCW